MKARTKTALRVAAWSASTVLVVGAAAGTATAATHHAKHKTPGGAAAPRAGGPGRPGGPGPMIHGIATIEKRDGTFETYATQAGKVTSVSESSITVVSADSYSATYAIDEDTHVAKDGAKADIGDVATGDAVFVRAEKDDGGYTAEVVGDGRPPAGRGRPAGPPPPLG
ncbi:MAG TPA: DUF5666 domain-containing protein [Mycobacteriales bacterium]|jgi:hypothetical protein|nr:DUF5666 domain-containing protein [Mycobacteriales bacterium]